MTSIRLPITAFIALLISSQIALACSCRNTSRAQAIKSADVVFQGKVRAVHRDGQKLYATIDTTRVLKGNVRTRVEVSTNASSAACGYNFRQGQTIIIGATYRERQYRTNLCMMLGLNRRK